MSYDLNVPWTPTISPATLTRTINFLTSLGYTTLALNHTITADSLPPQISNPIPASFLDTPTNTTLLRRCTLSFHDPSQNPRLSALAPAYDILAVRPTGVSDKAYLHACLSMPEISLISLDLAQRFSFHFKPKPLMTAINRGVFIEICYGQALNADRDGRRNFIGNVLSIVRATKGRGIVISGGCEGVGGVRAPGDVVNLLNVWGLGRERGMEALGVNPRGVVVNEGIKRRGFRGVVDVVYGGERSVVVKDMEEGGGEGKKDNKSGVGKKGKGKRKAEDAAITAEGTTPISKRAAKRAKKESLQASKETTSSAPSKAPMASGSEGKPQASTENPTPTVAPSENSTHSHNTSKSKAPS